jgi:hypothetical protein
MQQRNGRRHATKVPFFATVRAGYCPLLDVRHGTTFMAAVVPLGAGTASLTRQIRRSGRATCQPNGRTEQRRSEAQPGWLDPHPALDRP